jgi:hypothetical protein
MRKKLKRDITDPEPKYQRRLGLSWETVRVLGADELSQAIGGSACDTTSNPTEKITSKK